MFVSPVVYYASVCLYALLYLQAGPTLERFPVWRSGSGTLTSPAPVSTFDKFFHLSCLTDWSSKHLSGSTMLNNYAVLERCRAVSYWMGWGMFGSDADDDDK